MRCIEPMSTPGAPHAGFCWLLADAGNAVSTVTAAIPAWTVEWHEAERFPTVILDTFDWDFWLGGRVLLRLDGALVLHPRGSVEGATSWCRWAGSVPAGPGDLPAGAIAEALRQLAPLRRLTAMAKMACERVPGLIRNDDDKIVCTVATETYTSTAESPRVLARCLRIAPLRGYNEVVPRLRQALDPLLSASAAGDVFEACLEALGLAPDPEDLHPSFEFGPDDAAMSVVCGIGLKLLRIVGRNAEGVIADVDTECLHEYRVSLRRLRSLISQLGAVFEDTDCQGLRSTLNSLRQRTNALRDLDVYLLAEESYRGLLPARLQPGFDELFGDFRRRRRSEHDRVARYLSSPAFRDSLDSMIGFFSAPGAATAGPEGTAPIAAVAATRLKARYGKIRKRFCRLGTNASDEQLHKLRIQCKRLRYLLDFFAPLVPEHDATWFLTRLRQLQTHLGNQNDIAVQTDFLLRHVDEGQSAGTLTTEAALALGGVIGALRLRQTGHRRAVFKELDRFCADGTGTRFWRMIRSAGG